jgi:hypothetical protein
MRPQKRVYRDLKRFFSRERCGPKPILVLGTPSSLNHLISKPKLHF